MNTDWLLELAPELFMSRRGKVQYDPRSGKLTTRQMVRFGGQVLEGSGAPVNENTPENRRLFADAFATWAYEQLERERRSFAKYHTKRIPPVPLRQLQQQVKSIAHNAISLDDVASNQKAELIALAKLHTHLGNDFMAQLGATHKRHDHRDQSRQRGWQPKHKRKFDRRRDR